MAKAAVRSAWESVDAVHGAYWNRWKVSARRAGRSRSWRSLPLTYLTNLNTLRVFNTLRRVLDLASVS